MSERLCVVVPVYNEQAIIGRMLEKWSSALDALGIDYEIRSYNDGSRDDSLEVMHQAARRIGSRISVRDKPNGGHGHTILTGYREAAADGFDWVFQIDSDDEMGPEKFGELWSRRGDYDFLVGARGGRKQCLPRRVVSLASRLCVRIFYGKGVWDVNTPYRLMRVSAFRSFFQQIPLSTFAPNVIISGLAARHDLKCFETLVPQHDRTTGEVSIRKWKLLKAAIKSFSQTMGFAFVQLCEANGWRLFWSLVGISTLLKFAASTGGWNYDFDSYRIVADIATAGGNVYAETDRYNYGPIWFIVLGCLRALLGDQFRLGIILLLSLADAGIAALLWNRRCFFAAALFLLSNVTIHISGFHNQFDNVAVAVAFAALALMDGSRRGAAGARHRLRSWIGVLLLGVSITIKHVFVFMPIWFLFRRIEARKRVVCLVLPLAMFLASFIPYSGLMSAECRHGPPIAEKGLHCCAEDPSSRRVVNPPVRGIVRNVFMYKSTSTKNLYRCFLPNVVYRAVPTRLLFALCMIGLGFLSRKKSLFASGLVYTLGLFTFSSAMATQYYAIPSAAAAVYWNPLGLCYHVYASMALFFGHGDGALHPLVLVPCMLMTFGCVVIALRKAETGRLDQKCRVFA